MKTLLAYLAVSNGIRFGGPVKPRFSSLFLYYFLWRGHVLFCQLCFYLSELGLIHVSAKAPPSQVPQATGKPAKESLGQNGQSSCLEISKNLPRGLRNF